MLATIASSAITVAGVVLDSLLELATEHDVVLSVLRCPGHFVAEGSVLARFTPGSKDSAALTSAVGKQFLFGADRTPTQDIEFSIDQLVEVAIRALSPASTIRSPRSLASNGWV